MDDLRLDDLRILAALSEADGLSEASRALGRPKQTLSRRLDDLERALGLRLVARTGRRLRLTDDGEALATRAREIVRLADEAIRSIQDAQVEPTGTLRLTTTQVVADVWLAPLIAAYLHRFPLVGVDLVLTERRVDLIEEGFDAAVRVGPLSSAEGVVSALGPAAIRYVASPDYLAARGSPGTPADLAHHDLLTHPLGSAEVVWPFVSGARAVRGRLRANSAEVVRVAAVGGAGIALLPDVVAAPDLRSGALVEVLADQVPDIGGIWLVTPTRAPPARVRAFADLARAAFR
jgi:DNA-binding transcriptional LysR family regulator